MTGRLVSPTTCLPHKDGGIPFSGLTKDATSKLTVPAVLSDNGCYC